MKASQLIINLFFLFEYHIFEEDDDIIFITFEGSLSSPNYVCYEPTEVFLP
jgi:hypothetical protein